MNIFIITGKDNLRVIQSKLKPKYDTLNIQGTNDLMEGIETVANKHVLEEYDLFLIMGQNFIEDDLNSGRKISDKLNKACMYALKKLPIYFMFNEKITSYEEELRKVLTGTNVRAMSYKTLNISMIEKVMKEVLTLTGADKPADTGVQRKIIEEKKRKQQKQFESHIDRIHMKRQEQDDVDFSALTRVRAILNRYETNSTQSPTIESEDVSSKILLDIRNRIFEETPEPEINLGDKLNLKSLNSTTLSAKLSPQSIKEDLQESNQDYRDYESYMGDLEEVIKQLKESNEPNKHEMVMALIKEKSVANNQMHGILTEFMTEITKSSIQHVTEEYTKGINELQQFGEYKDIDSLIGDKVTSIEDLKLVRGNLKNSVGQMINQLTEATNSVNRSLSEAGKAYLSDREKIERELIEYANDNNITKADLTVVKDTHVLQTLKNGYTDVTANVNGLITMAQATVKSLMEIVVVDEQIIDKQDEVIDVLMTQKTKQILTVDNLLQTKLTAIVGPDGVGKTHTAVNMAKAESKLRKTMLVDLNIYNPNLIYYNKTRQTTSNEYWFNHQTILLEEFIHIPIGSHMHEQIPYGDNLTIIQPGDAIDLTVYESIVNPKVFSMHIKMFLEQLAQFYDKIIIILPYNMDMFGDLLSQVGTMYLVNDFEPHNLTQTLKLKEKHGDEFSRIPIKHFIINKTGRGTKLTTKEFIDLNQIDTREYKFYPITWLQESLQFKIEGKIAVEQNINIRKIFDELIKR